MIVEIRYGCPRSSAARSLRNPTSGYRADANETYDRSFLPSGIGRISAQSSAAAASGGMTPDLPLTAVIHGRADSHATRRRAGHRPRHPGLGWCCSTAWPMTAGTALGTSSAHLDTIRTVRCGPTVKYPAATVVGGRPQSRTRYRSRSTSAPRRGCGGRYTMPNDGKEGIHAA